MTDRIEPALSAEEWAEKKALLNRDRRGNRWGPSAIVDGEWLEIRTDTPVEYRSDRVSSLPALIALANAALPDSDPRKITRDDVRTLLSANKLVREVIIDCSEHELAEFEAMADRLGRLASTLHSYLPPEIP